MLDHTPPEHGTPPLVDLLAGRHPAQSETMYAPVTLSPLPNGTSDTARRKPPFECLPARLMFSCSSQEGMDIAAYWMSDGSQPEKVYLSTVALGRVASSHDIGSHLGSSSLAAPLWSSPACTGLPGSGLWVCPVASAAVRMFALLLAGLP